ncbi:MAG: hypothetical protein AAFR73_12810 [Pseudomonadota bacterium]
MPNHPEDLATSLYVAIRTAPRHVRRQLTGSRPDEGDAAARALAAHILKALERYTITSTGGRAPAPSTPKN